MSCFHVVLSRLVPPKPQTCFFPHGLKNTSDTPALEWLREKTLPPSMCGSAVITGIKALHKSLYISDFNNFIGNGNSGGVIITGDFKLEIIIMMMKLFV